ncbi:hypothetical protein [Rhodococcus ruber]
MTANAGSRGKIQDRCRHGSSASAVSHRCTVLAPIAGAMPSTTACRANSAADQRANGT